jgi:hypothetical protein
MRVLPADPEGEIVPSQGLAVNAIPAVGTVASTSDILILAPQTPDLAEEDMEVVQTMAEAGEVVPATVIDPSSAPNFEPSTQATAVSSLARALAAPAVVASPLTSVEALPLSGAPTSPAPSAVEEPDQQMGLSVPADETTTAEAIIAVADQVADGVEPLPPTPEAAPAPMDTARSTVTVLPPEVPGVVSAVKPVARPATLSTDASPAEIVPPVATAPASLPVTPELVATVVPAAAVASGTHLVQLGAFDSPEIAASEWARLQGRFRDFLGAREYVIQETQSGGRTLYRLRALGFPERADARILCAALTAEGADCIPVTVD